MTAYPYPLNNQLAFIYKRKVKKGICYDNHYPHYRWLDNAQLLQYHGKCLLPPPSLTICVYHQISPAYRLDQHCAEGTITEEREKDIYTR